MIKIEYGYNVLHNATGKVPVFIILLWVPKILILELLLFIFLILHLK